MNSIKVSAPGKLMLLGEHAVVYGYPCLVTAVDKKIFVTVEKSNKKTDEIITPQVKSCHFVKKTIDLFKKKFQIHEGIKISTQGDFSHQVGLGSSSAVTVATLKAMSEIFNIPLTQEEIFDMGYQVTLKIQGVGSGFDIAAATYGRTLYFITGGKKIEIINRDPLPLVVGYSGVKADTAKIVNNLKFKIENFKLKFKAQNYFEDIQILVEKGEILIKKKNWEEFGRVMMRNHEILQQLGVSTEKLDKMCQAASDAGAWGAKLSGAGGGDCMIALVSPEKKSAVEKAIENVSGEIIKVENNTEGAKIEK